MIVRVDVQRDDPAVFAPDDDFIYAWVNRALETSDETADTDVSVRIVSADEMRILNRDYRGKDRPTNVLSFPAGRVPGLPETEPLPLGDIVACAGVISNEAAAQGKALMDHWAHMLVHGTLHLLGFDHEHDTEAATMEALETRVLGAHGVTDPYGA